MQYLIDASVYVFRAYYSMPDDMVDKEGNPINALYGFCRFLGDFMEQECRDRDRDRDCGRVARSSAAKCFRDHEDSNTSESWVSTRPDWTACWSFVEREGEMCQENVMLRTFCG